MRKLYHISIIIFVFIIVGSGAFFVYQKQDNRKSEVNNNPKIEQEATSKNSDPRGQITKFYQLIESKNYDEARKIFPETQLYEYYVDRGITKIVPSDFSEGSSETENGDVTINFKLSIESFDWGRLSNTMQTLFNADGTIKDIKTIDSNSDIFSKNGKQARMEQTEEGFNIFLISEGKKKLIDTVIETDKGVGVDLRKFYFSPKENFLVYVYQFPMSFSDVTVYNLNTEKKVTLLAKPLFIEDEKYFFFCAQGPNMLPHHAVYNSETMNELYFGCDPSQMTYYEDCYYDQKNSDIIFDMKIYDGEKKYSFNLLTKKDSLISSDGDDWDIFIASNEEINLIKGLEVDISDSRTLNEIAFTAKGHCPNSGTEDDYQIPDGYKFKSCKEIKTECTSCITSYIVLERNSKFNQNN